MEKEVFQRKIAVSLYATITMGLEKGYTREIIPENDVYSFLSAFQNKLIEEEGVFLSASVSECYIVLSGQREKHLQLNFINYPKFPLQENRFKKHIEILAKSLMKEFHQNRIVILYPDETVMFEFSDEIDGRIKK